MEIMLVLNDVPSVFANRSHQVEAISNLGMVMKVKGAVKEAESLWMKAIKLRPTYWDAVVSNIIQ
jgi:hypothetical protein